MSTRRSLALALAFTLVGAAPALADSGSSAGASDPSMTLHVFVGPGFGLGNRSLVQTRIQTTTTTATTPGTNAITTTTATNSVTTSTLENGVGVVYGADLVGWASPEFGLGLDLFGSDLGAGASTTILSLNGQPASAYQNTSTAASGGTTTTVTQTDGTTVTPALAGAPSYTVTIGIPAAGATAPLSTTYSETGVGDVLKLQQGNTGTGNAKSTFASTGGMQFTDTTSMLLNDFGLSGNYALWRGPRGLVTLFGGVTVPVMVTNSAANASTVGASGKGSTAEQVETNFDASASVDAIQTTDTTISNSVTSSSTLIAMGPVVGVDAAYDVTSNLHVYTQLGYAPVLDGSVQTSGTTTTSTKTVITTTGVTAAGTVAGFANGTTTTSSNVPTQGTAIANVTGSETMGTIGAQYDLGALGLGNVSLYGELVARDYVFAATPQAVYGLRAGAGVAF